MSENIPIYIIHLENCARDIAPLLWHLNYLLEKTPHKGFDIEVFHAIHGHTDYQNKGITHAHTHPVFNDFSPHLPNFQEGLSFMRLALKSRVNFQSFGQLGCFASHYLLWQECVKLQKPIIVLEDDVLPTFDFFEKCALGLESLYSNKAQMVRLFALYFKRHRLTKSMGHHFDQLFSPMGGMGTQGYLLSPLGAQKLLENCPEQWILPVDTYIDAYYTHKVSCLTLKTPALFVDELVSQIQHASTDYFKGKLKAFSYLMRACNYALKCRLFVQHLLFSFLARKA
ncbi:Lipooligosaccharide 5G8 epitope biosynthesis-associated protein Lex2B [Helicobacter sp. NHP21005]|uniref:glycosyltransferase family 25 protein n=1 Tax=Helicobacter felistomachi TaxID=3040201 RepID=UPI0025747155|nr:glycosyltransferase family 25 protein [Helicobacter sp. NHP21005]BEG58028.1 Lipooligosaccharide 5G8 epitope biosynthesis-associated protein Lex2B [Helicobacter sp. NHP21005]